MPGQVFGSARGRADGEASKQGQGKTWFSDADMASVRYGRALLVSTWPFGKAASDAALATLQNGGSLLDAVELGIHVVEDSGNPSVGLSGTPNSAGVTQLDACIMLGEGHRAGSVAGLEGIKHP